MAGNGGNSNNNKDNKKRKRYLPYNKAVKKGGYPLRPGVQGFFITCDGGRERQASQEAINVIESFFEELVQGKDSDVKQLGLPNKPLNKKIIFAYSDSDEDDNEDNDNNDDQKGDEEDNSVSDSIGTTNNEGLSHAHNVEGVCAGNQIKEIRKDGEKNDECRENQEVEDERQPAKKQCLEAEPPKDEKLVNDKVDEQSVDKLIEAELEELKDKGKRRFNNLDSGCNGVVFVQMRKRDGDPSPKDIAQHMITSVAATKKHMSRFILRVLPVEVTCYASEEEITRAIKPLIAQYFPAEAQTPYKYAVLYEARANTGVERMKIINAVAKCVPEPHKVDLNNPDRNIVVQIAKTVCSIGVVEKYKELAKYNLRQLTTSK